MGEHIQEMEFRILDWIQANLRVPVLDWIMSKITLLGNYGILWIVIAVVLLMMKSRRRCGMTILAGLAVDLFFWELLVKNLVARSRPCWLNPWVDILIAIPKDYSFPSGHTLASFTAAVILLRYNRDWGIMALLAASLIGFSRLYLYVHFPTDVLAGVIFGILTGIAVDRLMETLAPRRASRAKKKKPSTDREVSE